MPSISKTFSFFLRFFVHNTCWSVESVSLMSAAYAVCVSRHAQVASFLKFMAGTSKRRLAGSSAGSGWLFPDRIIITAELIPLIKDKMIVAFPSNQMLKHQEIINIQDLQKGPFIMPTGMYQKHIENLFKQENIHPTIRFEVHDCNTIAPELFLKTQQNIHLGTLNLTHWRHVALACPSVKEASPAVREFLAVAKKVFKSKD
ncbi:LysR family transcriptional regulator substrate-binding protein [Lysinibacillus fusiformis]|nr:LysR family transcriptional regulator substrate-binding protein [Lysinibacillus fusiformis]